MSELKSTTLSKKFSVYLLIVSTILFAINLFLRFHIIPFHTTEIGGIEINVIDGIVKILSGNFLYTDPTEVPFDIIQYSPVYYFLVSGMCNLLGISFTDPHAVFVITRSVALLANFMTFLTVYLIARHFSLTKRNAFLAGIFSFIILTQHYYSRGDSLYCFLFFAAVYFFLKYVRSEKVNLLIIFSLISFVCIFTKQSGIIIPLTAGIFLLIKRKYKAIVITLGTFILLSLCFLAVSPHIGGIENFYRNVVLGVKNGTSLMLFESFFTDKYYIQEIFWVVIGFYLSIRLFKRTQDSENYFLLLLIFCSFLFAFVTGLKIGSSLNYFVECFILTFIAALNYINQNNRPRFQYLIFGYFLVTIGLRTMSLFSSVYISRFHFDNINGYETEKRVSEFLLKDLQLKKQDLVFLDFRGYTELYLTGNSIMNQKDFNIYVHKYAAPQIDYVPLLNQADNGLIKYILSKRPLEEVELLKTHFSNFKLLKTIDNISIYQFSRMK